MRRATSGDSWSWKRQTLTGDHAKNLENFRVSDDGKTIVYVASTAAKLPQLYRAELNGGAIASPVQLIEAE